MKYQHSNRVKVTWQMYSLLLLVRCVSIAFFICLIVLLTLPTAAHAQVSVAQPLIEKAQTQGAVRVVVRLSVRDLAPDTSVDSDMVSRLRRAQISSQRNALRSILFNVPHRVHREFEDFPFVALEA